VETVVDAHGIDALLPGEMAEKAEHANMCSLPFALMIKLAAPNEFWILTGRAASAYPHLTLAAAAANLLWVTVGSVLGGLTVGLTYWFVYLRGRAVPARATR
jgi:formate/nitrite transporter FocA (FNT family)